MMISAHHKLQQFLPNSWFLIKSQILFGEETKPNPISEPSCSKLLWNFKSLRISVFLLWRSVLNTCFLELLIKICHAVMNSCGNVTGSSAHQGQRGQAALPCSDCWIRAGQGLRGCGAQSSAWTCGAVWAPASREVPAPSPVFAQAHTDLDLQSQCPRFSSPYLFLPL